MTLSQYKKNVFEDVIRACSVDLCDTLKVDI